VAPPIEPARRAEWPGLLCAAVLAAGLLAAYARTFSVPLLYDDNSSIAGNPSIQGLWPIWPVLSPPDTSGVAGRPLLNLSYALNYAVGGTAVPGYHAVNLLIHFLAACTLFALARRTLRRPALAGRFGPFATPLALAISAIWAWHPVQTESVTYLSQRAESLMGLFYLLTLYCFLRGAETDDRTSRRIWFTLSVAACLDGVGTKETIVTAPLVALLYDRTFVSGSFSGAWRRNWRPYLALAATWLPLGLLMLNLRQRGVGFGEGAAWWSYGLSQCRAVAGYLLLCLWPHPLVFDYGTYVPARLSETWPWALLVALLLALTAIAVRRRPLAGFPAAWFFLILAPTSSIVPIVWQPMAENRLYLPLAGVAASAVLGAFALAGRRSLAALAVVALGLDLASAGRNRAYSSAHAIWSDTVAKRPENPRAHNNLGAVLSDEPGRLGDAIAQFREALRLRPDYADAHGNLGGALLNVPGRLDDAIAELREALRLTPDYADAHSNLGAALLNVPGRLDDAIAEEEEALRLEPDHAGAHLNLGNALSGAPGRLNDAVTQYEEALRLNPNSAAARASLARALSRMPGPLNDAVARRAQALRRNPDSAEAFASLGDAVAAEGRTPEAIALYEEALRMKPDFAEAHYLLGNAWMKIQGRANDAIAEFEAALRLKPDHVHALTNLGYALNAEGRTREAVLRFEEALRLGPRSAGALINAGNALNADGRSREAAARYEEALRLKPDSAEAHYLLGSACLAIPGRLDDAVAQCGEALRLRPDYADAHLSLAVALLRLPGRADEARAHLEACLRIHPGDAQARRILAGIKESKP